MRVAQDLFDHVVDNPTNRDPETNLLGEWRAEGDESFRRKLAEAQVLARLGALLHDFCHVPYGHTLEDDFKLLVRHDANEERFEFFWATVDDDLRDQIRAGGLFDELKQLVLSKGGHASESRYPVGNTICADLIDYLWRDYYFTGLPGRLGKRFLSYFFLTPTTDPDWPERMALKIRKGTRIRADVVTEVFKYLRYRYELSERVIHHHAKVAADTMVAKAVDLWIAAKDTRVVEANFRRHGDDGLLEALAAANILGASDLAADVRDRRLYKVVERSTGEATFIRRDKIYEQWSDSTTRGDLERKIAEAVGLTNPWHVLLTVPSPKMQLKAADVLVSDGRVTAPLRAWDPEHGSRAAEIYSSHERLWSLQLLVHPAVTDVQVARLAAYFSEELRVVWDPRPTQAASPIFEQALVELALERGLSDVEKDELRLAVHRREATGIEPFDDVKSTLAALIEEPRETSGDEEHGDGAPSDGTNHEQGELPT
jgi:HD superfamily phosphohydrolase